MPNMATFLNRSTSASLPSQSFWGKFKGGGGGGGGGGKNNKDVDMRDKQAQMAIARQRLLTLAYGDMETIRMVSYHPRRRLYACLLPVASYQLCGTSRSALTNAINSYHVLRNLTQ